MTVSQVSTLADCRQCARLVAHRTWVAQRFPTYHAAPVGSWGDARARLLLVGLAPGLHGAARTGKAFVGDASGDFLFAGLFRAGLASHADPARASLRNVRITNAVKCLPPGNSPTTAEVTTCAAYLRAELDEFHSSWNRKPRIIIALGSVAFRSVTRLIGLRGAKFAHGANWQVEDNLHLFASFHTSRLNVNTGRLTAAMLDELFSRAIKLL